MRSFGGRGPQPAAAGAAAGGSTTARSWPAQGDPPVMHRSSAAGAATTSAGATTTAGMSHLLAPSIPAGFDREGFERIAKMIFIRMQAAHDSADLNDLRQFTTPEMFAAVRLDLQERGASPNHTDVVKVDAEVLDVAQDADRQVVSVRFHGLVREDEGAQTHDFDEVWHLVRQGDSPAWAIAGIQQRS
jgi:predicted lipid-binding transport protein (Tim44 family)